MLRSHFMPPPGYVLDDATVHYNASCTGWVVGVFDDGISLQSFALCINRSGEFRLSSYVFPPREKNPPKPYLNTTCPINVSVTPPQYQPDIFPIRLGEYRRYLLTKVWFRNLGSGTFRINVPWELIAIYLESDTIYENGTYVPKLPLDVEVSWKGEEIDRTPALAEPPASYWIDISEEKPLGGKFS